MSAQMSHTQPVKASSLFRRLLASTGYRYYTDVIPI